MTRSRAQRHTRRQILRGTAAMTGVLAASSCRTAREPAPPPGRELSGTIRIFGWAQEPIFSVRQRAFDGFRARHPKLQVILETTGAAGQPYFDKLQVLIASDQAPDMFILPDSDLPGFLQRGLVRNLAPLIARDRYDLSDFPKAVLDAYRHEGGLYGLPDNISSIGFFVNVDLFQKAGMPAPPVQPADPHWTFEGFLDTMRRFAGRLAGESPIFGVAPAYDLNGILAWVRSNGGDLLTNDGSATALHEAAAVEALQFLADLRHVYRVAPTAQDLAATNALQLFEQGRLGIWEGCVCQIVRFRQNVTFAWDAAFRPAGKAGLVDHLYAYPQVLFAQTKNLDAAWEALKWFEDEGMIVLVQEGALQGTKMNAHQRKYFVDPSKPPPHAEVWVVSVERFGHMPPATTNWREVVAQLDRELAPLWNGQRSARETALAIRQTVDPLVAAGRWR
jgi:multiple sugar transport system substrate-binding protein